MIETMYRHSQLICNCTAYLSITLLPLLVNHTYPPQFASDRGGRRMGWPVRGVSTPDCEWWRRAGEGGGVETAASRDTPATPALAIFYFYHGKLFSLPATPPFLQWRINTWEHEGTEMQAVAKDTCKREPCRRRPQLSNLKTHLRIH